MNTLNTGTARIIDPVLTGIAQGYRHAQRVGHVLFPRVEVLQRGGQVIEFGKESFVNYNTPRAPGAHAAQIQFGYEGRPFSLRQFTLDVPIPREFMDDAARVPGIDLGKRATATAMDSLTLTLEIEQARIATDPTNYSSQNKREFSGSELWNNPDSDPLADIEAAKDQLRITSGIEPNVTVSKRGP